MPKPFSLDQQRQPKVRRLTNPDGSVYGANVVYAASDGQLAIEAENFYFQNKTELRMWHLVTKNHTPAIGPDSDPSHIEGASDGAYLELLPDVRQKDEDKMHSKTSISGIGGEQAVLTYMIKFPKTGKYFVWVRAIAVDGDDNTLHIGLDGKWPESSKQLTFQGRQWSWSNMQRDSKAPISIDIEKEGLHQLHVSMREDGCELDRIFITDKAEFKPTDSSELPTTIDNGEMPKWIESREAKMNTAWAFQESDGVARIEVESIPSTKGWNYFADGSGHAGLGYLEWSVPGQGIKADEGLLRYHVDIQTAGTYQWFIRGRIKDPKNRPDTLDPDSNDIWARVIGAKPVAEKAAMKDDWNKLAILGHPEGFTWNTNLDVDKTHPITPVCVALEAGRYTIELAGRSQGYAIDSLLLLKYDKEPIEDFEVAKSYLDLLPASKIILQ